VSDVASRRRRRRRTTLWLRVAAGVLGALLLFLVGVALGQALGSSPDRGTRTEVRTLSPLPLAPARETVTVTVSASAP
jgi:hypothetical protein